IHNRHPTGPPAVGHPRTGRAGRRAPGCPPLVVAPHLALRVAAFAAVPPGKALAKVTASASLATPERSSVWAPGSASSIASHSACSQTAFGPCSPAYLDLYTTHPLAGFRFLNAVPPSRGNGRGQRGGT